MLFRLYLILTVLIASYLTTAAIAQESFNLGGIRLPPEYRHQTRSVHDSIGGQIVTPSGLEITFGNGGSGGDRWPEMENYRDKLEWRREQQVGKYKVITAMTTDQTVLLTFVDRSSMPYEFFNWNFAAKVRSIQDVMEFMTLVMQYPVPLPTPTTNPAPATRER